MEITHKIKMDLSQRNIVPRIGVVQGDSFTRKLSLALFTNKRPCKIPADATAIIRYRKPNGESGAYDTLPDGTNAVSISGNCISILIAPEALSQPGIASLMVTILAGNLQLSTFAVELSVQAMFALDQSPEGSAWITAFLPAPGKAAEGQYFAVETVDRQGHILSLKAVDAPTGSAEEIRAAVEECLEEYDFSAGADGISVTHEWNGTVLTITSASGTSSANLKGQPGADGYTPVKGVDYFTEKDKSEMVSQVLASEEITQMARDISDLMYVPIAITSITNDVGTVEMGRVIENATVSWTLNKEVIMQALTGVTLDADDRSAVVPGPFTGNASFTLIATDTRENKDTAITSISFLNGVYYGVVAVDAQFESVSALILSLTKKLHSAKAITFTTNAGVDEQILFALPIQYGTPVFSVGGFEGGFSCVLPEVDFTNAYGYTEKYAVWASDNTGLGSTTVKVS